MYGGIIVAGQKCQEPRGSSAGPDRHIRPFGPFLRGNRRKTAAAERSYALLSIIECVSLTATSGRGGCGFDIFFSGQNNEESVRFSRVRA